MHIPKIRLAFAVIVFFTTASLRLSLAQDGQIKVSRLRADAIHTCGMAAAKFPDYSWGNVEMFVYRACMAEHSQQE